MMSIENRRFLGVTGLLFVASVAITIVWCGSMSAMAEMPMPGGWNMTMTWMLMPGQPWLTAFVSYLAMWELMMLAMMLPSLLLMLLRYREALHVTSTWRLDQLTLYAALGYFLFWLLIGAGIFPLGIGLNLLFMQYRQLSAMVPVAAGVVLLAIGLLQFSKWKGRHLACCRALPFHGKTVSNNVGSAFKHGLHLGLQCSRCTSGLMLVLLVMGMMNLWVMAAVTLVISFERLAPTGRWITGALGVMAGVFLIARATGHL